LARVPGLEWEWAKALARVLASGPARESASAWEQEKAKVSVPDLAQAPVVPAAQALAAVQASALAPGPGRAREPVAATEPVTASASPAGSSEPSPVSRSRTKRGPQ